jgi:hypothetical protein
VTPSPVEPVEEKVTVVTVTTPGPAPAPVTVTVPGRATTLPGRATSPKLVVTLPRRGGFTATRARLAIRNAGTSTATGVVTLSRRIEVRGTMRTQVLGRANVTVAAGRSTTVSVVLSSAGRRVVKGRTTLAVAATFALRASSAASARKVGVTLRR